jgi:alkanesulfonate monooxygenase SsuD/methylene tetrahydromethanopterin reductase-like flavin-dependent oxidoreductase (luciferase family)
MDVLPESDALAAGATPSLRFGVHTPLQHTSVEALRAVWSAAEAAGYDWISVWDHLGSLDLTPANFEAVAMHAALACHTDRVRCGCLVYSVAYRSPLVLASAIATIDHLSGGRAVLGLGAGYLAREFDAAGIDFGSPADRVTRLEETVTAVRALLDGDEVTTRGTYVTLDAARCAPAPVQRHVPIVVGGGGERRTIPLAARLADGWNVPMATPDDAARKISILRAHEAAAGREAGSVEATLSVGLCFDESSLPKRFGARWEVLRPAVLTGSTEQMIDHVARYRQAGADRVVLSVRPPLDQAVIDDLQRFAERVVPEFS